MNEQHLYDQLAARLELLRREGDASFQLEHEPHERTIRIWSQRQPDAARIVIEVEREDLLGLTIGKAAHFELYGKSDDDELLDEVIDWVQAVRRGGFTETVFWRGDEIAKSELRIVVNGSSQKIKYHSGVGGLLSLGRLRKQEQTYQPYA